MHNAQSPQAEPVRPSWKNMPTIAILANLPLASSADKLLVFLTWIAGGENLETEVARCNVVPADWSCEMSQKAP